VKDDTINEKPHSMYEVVTRQMIEHAQVDVKEVKDRVNALIWLIIGVTLLDLIMRLFK
jgi:hypothetical protein